MMSVVLAIVFTKTGITFPLLSCAKGRMVSLLSLATWITGQLELLSSPALSG